MGNDAETTPPASSAAAEEQKPADAAAADAAPAVDAAATEGEEKKEGEGAEKKEGEGEGDGVAKKDADELQLYPLAVKGPAGEEIELQQFLADAPETCFYTAYDLILTKPDGLRYHLMDYVEIGEVADVAAGGCLLEMFNTFYDDRAVRLHVRKTRELISMAGSYSSASTAMAAEYELVKGLATERELGGEEKEEGEGKEGEGEKGEKDGEKDGDEGGEWKKSGKGKKGKGRRSKEEEAKEKERREKEKERERKAKLPSSKARMEEIASLEQGVGLGDDPKGVLAKVMVKGGADEDAAPVCVESIAFSSFNPVPGPRRRLKNPGRGWMEEIAWASLEQGVGMGDDPKGVLAKVIVKGGADEDAAPVCVESIAFSSVNPVPGPRSQCVCVESIALSSFNPVPGPRRLQGDLVYLEVVTAEGKLFCVTAHTRGFFVNRSGSGRKLDPRPAEPKMDASTLIGLLRQISPLFSKAFAEVIERKANRHPFENMLAPLPPNDWAAKPIWGGADGTGPLQYTRDVARSEDALMAPFGIDFSGVLRDWNEELQSCRELPRNSLQDRILRDRALYRVSCEFADSAVRGAKAVIGRSIPPINPHDADRFHMYVHNNIFFSLAVDGDFAALQQIREVELKQQAEAEAAKKGEGEGGEKKEGGEEGKEEGKKEGEKEEEKKVETKEEKKEKRDKKKKEKKDKKEKEKKEQEAAAEEKKTEEAKAEEGDKKEGEKKEGEKTGEDGEKKEGEDAAAAAAAVTEAEQATYASSNNDLKGTMAVNNADIPGLYSLAMAIVDYRGHRVIAQVRVAVLLLYSMVSHFTDVPGLHSLSLRKYLLDLIRLTPRDANFTATTTTPTTAATGTDTNTTANAANAANRLAILRPELVEKFCQEEQVERWMAQKGVSERPSAEEVEALREKGELPDVLFNPNALTEFKLADDSKVERWMAQKGVSERPSAEEVEAAREKGELPDMLFNPNALTEFKLADDSKCESSLWVKVCLFLPHPSVSPLPLTHSLPHSTHTTTGGGGGRGVGAQGRQVPDRDSGASAGGGYQELRGVAEMDHTLLTHSAFPHPPNAHATTGGGGGRGAGAQGRQVPDRDSAASTGGGYQELRRVARGWPLACKHYARTRRQPALPRPGEFLPWALHGRVSECPMHVAGGSGHWWQISRAPKGCGWLRACKHHARPWRQCASPGPGESLSMALHGRVGECMNGRWMYYEHVDMGGACAGGCVLASINGRQLCTHAIPWPRSAPPPPSPYPPHFPSPGNCQVAKEVADVEQVYWLCVAEMVVRATKHVLKAVPLLPPLIPPLIPYLSPALDLHSLTVFSLIPNPFSLPSPLRSSSRPHPLPCKLPGGEGGG
ncbi:unnamed protein product [Closterium sp. NIES-53]